jgi:hypothetical protein
MRRRKFVQLACIAAAAAWPRQQKPMPKKSESRGMFRHHLRAIAVAAWTDRR